MKFHHHGHVSANPRTFPPAGVGVGRAEELPDEIDVLIVGFGPAGMLTAAQLSVFPDITTCIIEKRDSRLELGHTDGVQARTVETFQALASAAKSLTRPTLLRKRPSGSRTRKTRTTLSAPQAPTMTRSVFPSLNTLL